MGWRLFGGPRLNREQEDRLVAVEKRLEAVEIEWSEWFDKYRRLYARLAKRQEAEERAGDAPPVPRNGPSPSRTMNPLAAALMRPHGGD